MIPGLDRVLAHLAALPMPDRILALNEVRRALHEASPFQGEPVDCVIWVPVSRVAGNAYNPNRVAPPEMRLLERSIESDGYTQPVVAWPVQEGYEVVDGFHRTRVAKESPAVRARVHGHVPITIANSSRLDKGDRMAATVRHNRARGEHRVDAMSDIVIDLKRRNWSDEKVAQELGMEPDEVLRLSQIGGLASLFAEREFSKAWEQDRP